eukprot:2637654-Prymnesium_polylepis.1
METWMGARPGRRAARSVATDSSLKAAAAPTETRSVAPRRSCARSVDVARVRASQPMRAARRVDGGPARHAVDGRDALACAAPPAERPPAHL